MLTKELIQGKSISIDWQFTAPIEDHDNDWCEWMVTGTGSDGNTYSGVCQADRTDPEGCHDNEVTDIDVVREAVKPAEAPQIDMSVKYQATEHELSKYGIETKIKTFQEFENATFKLNKLYQDEQHY